MSSNNDPKFFNRFTANYARGAPKCQKCNGKLLSGEFRIGRNMKDEKLDKIISRWNHFDCITFSKTIRNTLDNFSDIYFAKYEDQLKLAKKCDLIIDENSETEMKIREENLEFFDFIEKLKKISHVKVFLELNGIEVWNCKSDVARLMNLAADCLMYGGIERCSGEDCYFGKFIYDHNKFQCRRISEYGGRCMEQTTYPTRKAVLLTDEFKKIFPDFVTKIRHRTTRKIYLHNSSPSTSKNEIERPRVADTEIAKKPKLSEVVKPKGTTRIFMSKGLVYAVILRIVDFDLHQDKFYKMKIIYDELLQFFIETSYGTFNTRMTLRSPILNHFQNEEKAVKWFENKFLDLTRNEFGGKFQRNKYKYNMLPVLYRESIQLLDEEFDEKKKSLIMLMCDTKKILMTLVKNKILNEIIDWKDFFVAINFKFIDELLYDCENLNVSNPIIKKVSSEFYENVPQLNDTGACQPMLNDGDVVDDKYELTEALKKSKILKDSMSNADVTSIANNIFMIGSFKLKLLDVDSDEFYVIANYLNNTFAQDHAEIKFTLEDAFEIDHPTQTTLFNQHSKSENRMLLWHGSPKENFLSILENGLKVPTSNNKTRMFGKGIYFADVVSKSGQYTKRCINDDHALLLLCEVALGTSYEVQSSLGNNFEFHDLPASHQSVKGIGKNYPDTEEVHTLENGTKVPWGQIVYNDAEDCIKSLNFNEFIIYDENRYNFKYLIKVKFEKDYACSSE